MATKLERLQRLRPLKEPHQKLDQRPFMLPYTTLDTPNTNTLTLYTKSTQNEHLSSRGLDNWNLNNNLKQFSETRQVGFFKNKKGNQRHKSNPYIIHKVRTPDIRNLNREHEDKSMEHTQNNFKKDHIQTHSTVQQDKVSKILLENVLAKYEKTNTAKFYPLSKINTKIQPKIEAQEGYSIEHTNKNPIKTMIKSFRKNRFEVSSQNDPDLAEKMSQSVDETVIDPPQQCQQLQVEQLEAKLQQKNHASRVVSFQMKKKSINKAIESINRGFLSQMDNYFDYTFKTPSIQAEVQIQINTITQPQRSKSVNEKSSQQHEFFGEYDFFFQQERTARIKPSKYGKKYKLAS